MCMTLCKRYRPMVFSRIQTMMGGMVHPTPYIFQLVQENEKDNAILFGHF